MRGAPLPLVLAAAALWACGGPERTLVVYTPLEPDLLAWIEEAYREARPEVDLRLAAMPPEALQERLTAEREDPAADVVWGVPSWTLAGAAAAGLLAETHPAWAELLSADRRDEGGRWLGSSVDPIVLAFDHRALSRSRAPRDWLDLLHPRFAGDLLVPEPGATLAGDLILGARAAAAFAEYGDEVDAFDWLVRLDAQQRAYGRDEVELVERLARGEGLIAPVRLSVAEAARAAGRPIEYLVPESGTPLLVRGVAVVAGAREPEEAAAFVEWLGGAAVARELASRFAVMPARTLPPSELPEWMALLAESLPAEAPPAETLAAHLDGWVERWRTEAKGRGTRVLLP